jgi:hypothetical protein
MSDSNSSRDNNRPGEQTTPEVPRSWLPGDWPEASTLAGEASLPTSVPPPHRRLGRFTVLHGHAEGGLGRVSVARDEQFGRQVALKEIRPDCLESPAARERFLTEAEITGQLEHPNIVPVCALDRDADGVPYYAMRFVEGRTLAAAIADYHRAPSPLALNALLRRFIAVC